MSKYKPVTLGQMECARKIANEKKTGRERFQNALDKGEFGRWIDSLNTGAQSLVPPPGARIHVIRVKVKQDCDWQEAVSAAGPNTPDNFSVWKVGNLFVPVGTGEVEEELVLLNYPNGDGSWYKALAWAKGAGLKNTDPRQVFPVGTQYPNLNTQLGQNPMYVVATTECTFEGNRDACSVGWGDSKRGARLSWVFRSDSSDDWFAFRK